VFPVLPQPDTSKLLANLQLRQQQQQQHQQQQQQQRLLPAAPQLPNVPLPNSKCYSSPHSTPVISSSSPVIVPRKSQVAAAEPSSASLISSSCPVSFPSSSHTLPQSSSSSLSASVLPGRSSHSYNNLLKVDASKLSEPRLGADFQAIIPPPPTNQKRDAGGATTNQKRDTGGADAETLMWSPRWAEDLPPNQLEEYLRVCSSAAAAGGGLSTEEALRILGSCHSNVFQVVPGVPYIPYHCGSGRIWNFFCVA
jgi:hypothetical protein